MRAGILFPINHVDPPLRAKGAKLICFIIQGKFRDVNNKEGSLLPWILPPIASGFYHDNPVYPV